MTSPNSLPQLESCFSDERMLRQLCRKRVELSGAFRREQLVIGLTGGSATARAVDSNKEQLLSILPPRSLWGKFRPDKDKRRQVIRQGRDAPSALVEAMWRFSLNEIRRSTLRYRWAENLVGFLTHTRMRALGWSTCDEITFERPEAIAKEKAVSGAEFRLIAIYSIADALISSGYARYLAEVIEWEDSCLIPTTYAFRLAKPHFGGDKGAPSVPPTHHDAVAEIVNFQGTVERDQPIWVAECDIKGFYDVVPHEIILPELKSLLRDRLNICDDRMWSFLQAFLRGYFFCDESGVEGNIVVTGRELLLRKGIRDPRFKSPLKELSIAGMDPLPGRIGIPQGSAISCILANVVLLLSAINR